MTTVTYETLSASEHSAQLRKAVVASTIGTTIEWYDFFIYGTAAGLIFGKLYFPNESPLAATLAAFGTYFIGFVGRPIGAAIFGHYGDRIGRKATLIATLMAMGIATFLIAFVPTYASIGIWGAVILTIQRLVSEQKIARAPIAEVIRRQPKEIIMSALARMAEQAPFYIFTAFVFSYGTGTLKISRDLILTAVLVASVLSFVSIPLSGHIS